MTDAAAIDWPQLRTRCLNDNQFVQQMLDVFRLHAPATLEKLRAAVARNDVAAANKQAHTLKGSAANLAAEPLRIAAFAAEVHSKSSDLAAVQASLEQIDQEMGRCLAEINRAIAAK